MKPNETAVIFIEFQNEFCHPDGGAHVLVSREMARIGTIKNARRLLDGARLAGCKIIHSPFTLDREWVEATGVEGLLSGLAREDNFVPGTWGQEIIDEMKPLAGEFVLTGKRALSAFSHTNLDETLRAAGIKNVVVCGFLSNACVQATAWGAYDRGYRTRIITDACASPAEPIQDYVVTKIVPMLVGVLSDPTVDGFFAELNEENEA